MSSIGMDCKNNNSVILLCVAATMLSIAAGPVSGLVLHPGGEPNLAVWTDRPSENVVGRWGSYASCVAIAPNCIITTRHQGGGLSSYVEIAGVRYTISQIWEHETADLRLAKLHGANLGEFVDIYEHTNESGKQVVLAGYGVAAGAPVETAGTTYGYEWDVMSPRTLHMGTNQVENPVSDSNLAGLVSDVLVGDFDGLGEGGSTQYESIAAQHDSGGGWFIKDGGAWKVAALMRAVEPHFEPEHEGEKDYILQESWFRQREHPTVPDADVHDGVRISSYTHWIEDTLPGVLAGDLTGDDQVDGADFSVFARHWGRTDCKSPDWCLGSDNEGDGDVDAFDMAYFGEHWLDNDSGL
ncbi:MAG: hypothetical protein JW720_15700 [Sedimentisphaerales bacterium]|nr:hypothetical protein [Sedimentisphaerales bacterium]